MKTNNRVPNFGIGELKPVVEYVEGATLKLCTQLGLTNGEAAKLLHLSLASCRACAEIMPKVLTIGMVESVPEARALWNYVGNLLLHPASEFRGHENLDIAIRHLQAGGNVLMVQNHRSGADTMVWETLVNRHYGCDMAQDWAYMSGHAVNLYLIPFMFTAAVRRFQIFSVKYQSAGLVGIANDQQMQQQNLRALRALALHARKGGKLVGLYPEGGRGDSAMKVGEPQTMCVGLAMAKANSNLMVLPTYVDGATNLLPVVRGSNEYNEVFVNAQRGKASLAVGKPVMWQQLLSHPDVGSAKCVQERGVLCDLVLSLVAALAPNKTQMGPHAFSEIRSAVARLNRD